MSRSHLLLEVKNTNESTKTNNNVENKLKGYQKYVIKIEIFSVYLFWDGRISSVLLLGVPENTFFFQELAILNDPVRLANSSVKY